MTLIPFTSNDRVLWVNPEQVAFLRSATGKPNETVVFFPNSPCEYINLPPDAVAKRLQEVK